MPRYLVERSFGGVLALPLTAQGAQACTRIVAVNGECGVTWIVTYLSADRRRSFCVHDAPSPEAIRHVARRNGLPVTQIIQVSELSPWFPY
jgi:hypothetical protein